MLIISEHLYISRENKRISLKTSRNSKTENIITKGKNSLDQLNNRTEMTEKKVYLNLKIYQKLSNLMYRGKKLEKKKKEQSSKTEATSFIGSLKLKIFS